MRTLALLAGAILLTGIVIVLVRQGDAVPMPRVLERSEGPAASGSPATSLPSAATARPLPSGYTFHDEFDGDGLSPVWQQHFNFDGIENTWSSSQATVADGLLSITASRSGDGWVSQLLDTKTTWTQLYGRFEARMKIPRGRGLWPAFWSYRAGNGGEAEIDTMEVCANPVGENGRNDVSVLHNTIRWAGGQADGDARPGDLSLDFHVYGVEWRPDSVVFTLDGAETWRFTRRDRIPDVALPLIVDLAVGGAWCGPADATTPDGAVLLVDWIRASP